MKIAGIEYQKPKIILLNEYGIGVSEIAARTCYDSFENSENESIKLFNEGLKSNISSKKMNELTKKIHKIEESELLTSLAWVHHHYSILEHTTLSFYIEGTSRGVLQEHARHRMQAISVRSTRYTMSDIINYFVISLYVKDNEGYPDGYHYFLNKILELDMFVTSENKYNRLEIHFMYTKLNFQLLELGMEEFMNVAVAKSILTEMKNVNREFDVSYLEKLLFSKKKRNVGDNFKHIVSDNWKVNMVVTFNLRSLKNYFTLRDSGAAYFQIQWLAEEMKKVIPEHYLNLIVKQK